MTTTTLTKRKTAAGGALAGLSAMLLAAALCMAGAGGLVSPADLALTAAGLLLTAGLARLPRRGAAAPLARLPLCAFCALGSYAAVQLLSKGALAWSSEAAGPIHLLGLAWVLALYAGLCALGGGRFAVLAGGALLLAFGAANYALELFRGRPLLAIDILSLRTALNVAGSYALRLDAVFFTGLLTGLGTLGCALCLCPPRRAGHRALRLGARLTCLVLAAAWAWLCLGTNYMYRHGIHINWDENEFAESAVMYFVVTAQKLDVDAPEGYSDAALDELAAGIENGSALRESVYPHIIVVMSEAFSDLSAIGAFETSEPVTPFLDSLAAQAVHGTVYSSVLGGNTANSEYEFLTGDTMAFIPTGSVPYQLYINYACDSLVSILKAQGYTATALHPYLSSGWNRVQVYDLLGFDRVLWKDDFEGRTYLRNYVTDASNYKNLIRLYEEREPGERLFLFNITMQNHGSYSFADFTPTVTITGHEGAFPQAEQYLSLLRLTDEATRALVEYFAGVDEPVLLLFFGDHQPNLDEGLYDLLYGHDADELTLEERQRRYATPFFLWANYGLEARDAGATSINYLAQLLLEAAGLETSDYGAFLSRLSEAWPAINANGVMDADGVWHSLYDELAAADPELLAYRMLQYNRLFDPAGLRQELFSID